MKPKSYVYIVNKNNEPLMPTTRHSKIRRLLKSGLAVVINNHPFTIKLKYETPDIVQPLTLGIDTGRENIGEGVSDEQGNCVFLCNTETKNKSIKKNMDERKAHRQERRRHARQKKQRKALKTNNQLKHGEENILRSKKSCKSINISYPGMDEFITCKVIKGKESKFNNRRRPEGWLTPSGRQLIQVYFNCIKQTMEILPISQINIESVCFDFQKLENQDIKVWEYSKGTLYGFNDYKEYIFSQQLGKCLLCGEPITQYHHIVPQSKNGSNTPKNIAGLCDCCHDNVHKDLHAEEELLSLKNGIKKQYEISLLNTVMPFLLEELDKFCLDNKISLVVTDGYTTKKTRETLNLPKDHCYDGYCISMVNKLTSDYNFITNKVYKRRRFKKKSNNNIKKLNSRLYKLDGVVVATNRHKATEQKTPSLEEYLNEYSKTHSKLQTRQHFHQLEVCPAKRTYTFHKKGEVRKFKVGDKILCKGIINKVKKNFIIIAERVKQNNIVYNNGKNSITQRICKLINSNSVSYIN